MTTNVKAIEGLIDVLSNVKTVNSEMAAAVQRGLIKAGLKLQAESQDKVPVEYGALKASAYTRPNGRGFATEVFVGYTAAYAAWVHELVDMKLKGQPRPSGQGKYWDPTGKGQAKFLEEPLRRLGPELIEIVRKEMVII